MIGPSESPGVPTPEVSPPVFLVEWSDAAQAFRVSEFAASMRANFQAWYSGAPTDYRPLACFLAPEPAHEFIRAIEGLR